MSLQIAQFGRALRLAFYYAPNGVCNFTTIAAVVWFYGPEKSSEQTGIIDLIPFGEKEPWWKD